VNRPEPLLPPSVVPCSQPTVCRSALLLTCRPLDTSFASPRGWWIASTSLDAGNGPAFHAAK
jgi:hypothetical protein